MLQICCHLVVIWDLISLIFPQQKSVFYPLLWSQNSGIKCIKWELNDNIIVEIIE